MDDNEILIQMYREEGSFARHHERLRSNVASLIIIIAGASLGLVTFDRLLDKSDIPLLVFLMFLGVFGAIFNLKCYERVRHHVAYAQQYRRKLDYSALNGTLKDLRENAKFIHACRFPRLSLPSSIWRLHYFWIALNGLIAVLGLAVLVFVLAFV